MHQLQGSRKRVSEREEGRAESGKDTGALKSPQNTWQHLCVSFKGRCTCVGVHGRVRARGWCKNTVTQHDLGLRCSRNSWG